MSGITPPSIVTYNWQVRAYDPSFVNVSFPFRVKIESIWFTTTTVYNSTNGLWEGVVGDFADSERTLRLAAIKTKNAKNPVDNLDAPSDYGFFFGADGMGPIEEMKPAMWLGNPDDLDHKDEIGTFSASGTFGIGNYALRSTAKSAPEVNDANNSLVANNNWTFPEFEARAYKTDMSLMNVDEMLQLFVYPAQGDWSGYDNNAYVNIHVAYSGINNSDQPSAPVRPFTDWWND